MEKIYILLISTMFLLSCGGKQPIRSYKQSTFEIIKGKMIPTQNDLTVDSSLYDPWWHSYFVRFAQKGYFDFQDTIFFDTFYFGKPLKNNKRFFYPEEQDSSAFVYAGIMPRLRFRKDVAFKGVGIGSQTETEIFPLPNYINTEVFNDLQLQQQCMLIFPYEIGTKQKCLIVFEADTTNHKGEEKPLFKMDKIYGSDFNPAERRYFRL